MAIERAVNHHLKIDMQSAANTKRYYDLNTFLRSEFGFRVQKIAVDAGFTCPNRDGTLSKQGCIYCDPLGSGTGAWALRKSVGEQIRDAITVLKRRYKAKGFLAYFQSFSNTYGPIERLKALYDEALAFPEVLGLCVGTRPDCVDEPVLKLLAGYAEEKMVWIELGLQSANDATLKRINRGHDVKRFVKAVELCSQYELKICVHIILGLPGEGPEDAIRTAEFLSGLPVHGIKIHSLYVVENTALASMVKKESFRLWTRRQYVESVCDVLERIPGDWVVQRITGDPPKEGFVGPDWTRDKQETIRVIMEWLEKRNTWQGRLLGYAPPEGN